MVHGCLKTSEVTILGNHPRTMAQPRCLVFFAKFLMKLPELSRWVTIESCTLQKKIVKDTLFRILERIFRIFGTTFLI